MLTDSQLIHLCAASYSPAVQWDELWSGQLADGIWFAIKKVGDDTVGVFRGSVTPEDWFRDFLALPHYVKPYPQMGFVHRGFDEGLDELFEKAAPHLGRNPYIVGHSLGAARAWLFAGRLVLAGNAPTRIAVCGSPRPAGRQFRDLMATTNHVSYRNQNDPVTLVPFTLPPWLPFVDPADFTYLNERPMRTDLLASHDISLYGEGVALLEKT